MDELNGDSEKILLRSNAIKSATIMRLQTDLQNLKVELYLIKSQTYFKRLFLAIKGRSL